MFYLSHAFSMTQPFYFTLETLMKLITVLLIFIFILAQSLFTLMVSKYHCNIYCRQCIVCEDFRCHYYVILNGRAIVIIVLQIFEKKKIISVSPFKLYSWSELILLRQAESELEIKAVLQRLIVFLYQYCFFEVLTFIQVVSF